MYRKSICCNVNKITIYKIIWQAIKNIWFIKIQYGLKSINSVGFNEISVKINCFGTKIEIYKEYKI